MTRPKTFDLQAHSTHSDGALPAREVVQRAAAAGVELFALTDHDSVDGVQEAIAHATIKVIPAVELSAVHRTTRTCTSSATASTTPTRGFWPR